MKLTSSAFLIATTFLTAWTPADAQQENRQLELVATFFDAMPTGVTVTSDSRIFVNYPRWGDDVPFTVAELIDGKAVAYPDAAFNRPDEDHPASSLLSVQSVVVGPEGRLWILDTGAPAFSAPVKGAPKLVAVDLETNRIVKTVVFPDEVILPTTYVNDMRFDMTKGAEGVAYVTDSSLSGPGAIIVIDLATGKATRRLNGDASTAPEPGFVAKIDGIPLENTPPDGPSAPVHIASDGIAISPDGKTLYFSPLTSRHLFSVPTAALNDENVAEETLSGKVRDLGLKGASDGLESDDDGRVFTVATTKIIPSACWKTGHGRRSANRMKSSGRTRSPSPPTAISTLLQIS